MKQRKTVSAEGDVASNEERGESKRLAKRKFFDYREILSVKRVVILVVVLFLLNVLYAYWRINQVGKANRHSYVQFYRRTTQLRLTIHLRLWI